MTTRARPGFTATARFVLEGLVFALCIGLLLTALSAIHRMVR